MITRRYQERKQLGITSVPKIGFIRKELLKNEGEIIGEFNREKNIIRIPM